MRGTFSEYFDPMILAYNEYFANKRNQGAHKKFWGQIM